MSPDTEPLTARQRANRVRAERKAQGLSPFPTKQQRQQVAGVILAAMQQKARQTEADWSEWPDSMIEGQP